MKSRFSGVLIAAALSLALGGQALAGDSNGTFPTRPDAAVAGHIRAWKDAMRALATKGYTGGILMPSTGNAGSWFGVARDKNGKRVDVTVDATGKVTAREAPSPP